MDVPELKHAPTERHLFEAILNKTVVNILVQVVFFSNFGKIYIKFTIVTIFKYTV